MKEHLSCFISSHNSSKQRHANIIFFFFHLRGIVEAHILFACHLFQKLHNLGEQMQNSIRDTITPHFHIPGKMR